MKKAPRTVDELLSRTLADFSALAHALNQMGEYSDALQVQQAIATLSTIAVTEGGERSWPPNIKRDDTDGGGNDWLWVEKDTDG